MMGTALAQAGGSKNLLGGEPHVAQGCHRLSAGLGVSSSLLRELV